MFRVGYHPFPHVLDRLINDGLSALCDVFGDEDAKDRVDEILTKIYEEEKKHEGEVWRPMKKEQLDSVKELLENGRE